MFAGPATLESVLLSLGSMCGCCALQVLVPGKEPQSLGQVKVQVRYFSAMEKYDVGPVVASSSCQDCRVVRRV